MFYLRNSKNIIILQFTNIKLLKHFYIVNDILFTKHWQTIYTGSLMQKWYLQWVVFLPAVEVLSVNWDKHVPFVLLLSCLLILALTSGYIQSISHMLHPQFLTISEHHLCLKESVNKFRYIGLYVCVHIIYHQSMQKILPS